MKWLLLAVALFVAGCEGERFPKFEPGDRVRHAQTGELGIYRGHGIWDWQAIVSWDCEQHKGEIGKRVDRNVPVAALERL